MNGGMRLLSLSLLILTLCSCVSVSTLKKGDCQNANWQEVGILDGKQGSDSQKIQPQTNGFVISAVPRVHLQTYFR